MQIFDWAAIACCIALAINIGGNNSASEMGPAYGARARTKFESLLLVAIFSFVGAIFSGDRVVKTVASGLVDSQRLAGNSEAALIILFSAGVVIASANYLRLPVATSHATVAAIVGFGLKFDAVHWQKVMLMTAWWVASPVVALSLSYIFGRLIYRESAEAMIATIRSGVTHSRLLARIFLTFSGCFLAFSAGSNGLAKAIGPVVGAGTLTPGVAHILGGLGLAAGAIFIGSRVIETVSDKITTVNTVTAVSIELITGAILISATQAGIPVSVAEIVTFAIVGFAAARSGLKLTIKNEEVTKIIKLWLVCPVLCAMISYVFSILFLNA